MIKGQLHELIVYIKFVAIVANMISSNAKLIMSLSESAHAATDCEQLVYLDFMHAV